MQPLQPNDPNVEMDGVAREILTQTGALLTGHFLLTSGLHSNRYFQAMRILQYPCWSALAASRVAAAFKGCKVDAVFAPALGGIVWGYELARCFADCRSIFAERVDGKMTLRRSFEIQPGESILLAEDVTTTGGSVMELKAIAETAGAKIVGVGSILDRSGGAFQPGVPMCSWVKMNIETWKPEDCPLCKAGGTAVKPGSRGLAK